MSPVRLRRVRLHACMLLALCCVGVLETSALEAPSFNHAAGRFSTAFQLQLDAAGAEIWYRTDGALPSPGRGTRYTGPIAISHSTVIRAVAVQAGVVSAVETRSFLRLEDVPEQAALAGGIPADTFQFGWGSTHLDATIAQAQRTQILNSLASVPLMSLVGDPADFFSADRGIMADPDRQEREWEKAVSLEWLPVSGTAWQVNCGVQLDGQDSAYHKKKPLNLRFRREYGPSQLRLPLFDVAPDLPVGSIRLRQFSYDNPAFWPQVTQQWIENVLFSMRGYGPRGTFCHVFINGVYWGLYNPVEIPDQEFAATHLGGESKDWDHLRIVSARHGDTVAQARLLALGDLSLGTQQQRLQHLLALQDYFDYRIAGAFFDYESDAVLEHHYLRNRRTGLGFQVFLWDTAESSAGVMFNTTQTSNWKILRRDMVDFPGILDQAHWRLLFADRVERHLQPGGALTSEALQQSFKACFDPLLEAFWADKARWLDRGIYVNATSAATERQQILDRFIAPRPAVVLARLRQQLGFALPAPSCDIPGQIFNGSLSVSMNAAGQNIYYCTDGSDPRRADGSVSPKAVIAKDQLSLTFQQSTQIRARCFDGSQWGPLTLRTFRASDQPLGNLRLEEIHYHPANETEQPGLQGSYSSMVNGRSNWTRDRVDAQIDFDWGDQPPLADVSTDFEANWSASLRFPQSGTWTLAVRGNGSVSVYVDNDLQAQHYSYTGDETTAFDEQATLLVEAGEPVPLGLLFNKIGSTAALQLRWKGPDDSAFTTIPASAFVLCPSPATDDEFIELRNAGSVPLDLSGCRFAAGIFVVFPPDTLLAPGQRLVLTADPQGFSDRYGFTAFGSYAGRLNDTGESLVLRDQALQEILRVTYGDSVQWPRAADGAGSSLVYVTGDPNDPASWAASKEVGGSPGAANTAAADGVVIISEALTHSDPEVDWIELYNPGSSTVDVSGWYLTDDRQNPTAWKIPTGSSIAPGGYLVFDENAFGSSFRLSSLGEEVVLFAADATGTLTGYSHGLRFGAQFNGISFGRHVTSLGKEHFVRQVVSTPGAANSGVKVGPMVISEIQYNPTLGEQEFVEIVNLGAVSVDLGPNAQGHPWRLEGTGFVFPAGAVLPARGVALVVGGDPAAFRLAHSIASQVTIYGPFPGKLDNGGETIALQAPDGDEIIGGVAVTPWVVMDQVDYNDSAPWPVSADGAGDSLQRKVLSDYGDDVANWQAAAPTPGQVPTQALRRLTVDVQPGAGIEASVDGDAWQPVPRQSEHTKGLDHQIHYQDTRNNG